MHMHIDEAGGNHVSGEVDTALTGRDSAQATADLGDAPVFDDQGVVGGDPIRQDQIGASEDGAGHVRHSNGELAYHLAMETESRIFRASRFTKGNRIFPAEVEVSPTSVTLRKRRLIGKKEESIHIAHIASIKIDTHFFFSDVYIESSGGENPEVCHGHTKGDAIAMKELIEKYQTDYYKRT